MSTERNSFTFYLSFEKAISRLSNKNQLLIYRAISRYSLFGEEIKLEGIPLTIWEIIKPTLDKSRIKSESGKKARGIEKPSLLGNCNAKKQSENKAKTKRDRDRDRDIKENITKKATLSLSERQEKFKEELQVYTDKYGRDMIFAFYDYWSEPNQPNTKMKLELQKTWSLAGRLRTWERRSNGK